MNLNKNIRGISLSIWAVILKNFKTIFRSRSSTLIIIVGPLLVMALVGMAFNNSSIFDIKVATYSQNYSELSDQIVEQLVEKSYLIIQMNSTFDCVSGTRSSEYNVCIIFPENMNISNNVSQNITFYVDPSRINIVDSIIADINKEVLKKSYNISLDLTNIIVEQLFTTEGEINNNLGLFGEIYSNQENLQNNLRSTKDKADGIDLLVAYGSFKVSELRDEVGRLATVYNFSEPDLSAVNNKVNNVDLEIQVAIKKVDSAKSKIGEISGDLGNYPLIIDDNTHKLNIITDSLNQTASDINNIVITNPESIARPINTKIQPVAAQKTHLGRFLPTFIVLVILFVSVLLASNLTLSERTSSAYFRNTITTTPPYIFLFGAYITSLVIILLQLLIISLGMYFIVGYEPFLFTVAIVPLLLIISMFILLGIVVGYFTHSQETANVASLFMVFGLLFFSNTILPLEALPTYLKNIILYNPFVVSEFALRKVIVFDFVLDKIKEQLLRLIFYNILFGVASYFGLKHAVKKVKEK